MNNHSKTDILNNISKADVPNYLVAEAARYLRLPASTVRSWSVGRYVRSMSGQDEVASKFAKPLIEAAGDDEPRLSFSNLIELHILASMRESHGLRMPVIRRSLDHLK